ncbi:S-layer homology domain-containing protein [Geobacillus sp. B4113_201601]|uniref:S-layer homology domain-containing protein n=1 Tax=Geobacillus sp. B4113_201601 TaxID=1586290 RepID=UPI000785C4D9|nr:S-layer homology domain-containing protein [Geobacillus sp. B4113_201601]KYD30696.1 hypothetical protein B4113_3677 [Geobacillus sp. B4113_201601]
MEERKERTWKGAVKYLKVAAASTLMASIGSAYTFDTVYADTNGVNNNVKIEEIFNQTILSNAPFKDVQADFWAADSIRWAISYGVIKGDVNGFFRPNDVITEAEFAEMIGHFYKSLEKEITDVATKEKISWQDATYKVLAKYRVPLMGYKDAFYRKSPLTKGLLAQVLAYTNGQKSDLDHAIYYVLDKGIVVGKSETGKTIYEKFGHKDHLTRAQTIVVLHRLYNIGNRDLAGSVIKGKVEDVNKGIQLAEAQVNKEVVEKKEGVHVVPVTQPKVESAQVKATSTAKKVVTSKTSSTKLVTPKKPLTVKTASVSMKKPSQPAKKPTTSVKKPATSVKKPAPVKKPTIPVKKPVVQLQKPATSTNKPVNKSTNQVQTKSVDYVKVVGDIYAKYGLRVNQGNDGFNAGGRATNGEIVMNMYRTTDRTMGMERGDLNFRLAALAMERLGYGDSDAIYNALVKMHKNGGPPIKVGKVTVVNGGRWLVIFY